MRRIAVLPFIFLLLIIFIAFETDSMGKSEYAGSEACKGCHQDYYGKYIASVHAKKNIPGSPAKLEACESCHGPGSEHVNKGGGKGGIFVFNKKGDPNARSARCLSCHEESRQVAFWDMGRHKKNGVACDDCHVIHATATNNLKSEQNVLCFNCHQDIRAEFNKQSHHPVQEGLIKCSDCHEVHGNSGRKMIKADTVNELCYECHAEKRGPFMWEHPPVEEKCLNCHEAHGSSHRRLLERKVPQLCQSCHDVNGGGHFTEAYTSFHTFNGAATGDKNKFYGRSCLNCHTNIHGGNGPGVSGQLFLR